LKLTTYPDWGYSQPVRALEGKRRQEMEKFGVYVVIVLFVLGMIGITYMQMAHRKKGRKFKDERGLK